MTTRCTLPLRVRYAECDPMGFVHHSVYPIWFELARTELLRAGGAPYAELERAGARIVVAKLDVSYLMPAHYDEELEVAATLLKVGRVRIVHGYAVRRGDDLLCTGQTTLAALDARGRPAPVPAALRGAG